jgi:hypothetical protein
MIFDYNYYLDQNKDLKKNVTGMTEIQRNAFLMNHFNMHGRKEKRKFRYIPHVSESVMKKITFKQIISNLPSAAPDSHETYKKISKKLKHNSNKIDYEEEQKYIQKLISKFVGTVHN